MARGNGKPEIDPAELDPEHELPPADDGARRCQCHRARYGSRQAESRADSFIDRLARLQAEFENARKRTAANSRSSASMPSPTR